MKQQFYCIESKGKDCYPFDEWITKFEMRCFGWVYKGMKSYDLDVYDVSIDWDKEEATLTQKRHSYNEFHRINPYSRNVLFVITEFFMNILSWIRRKLTFLLLPLGLFSLFGLITSIAKNDTLIKPIAITAFFLGLLYLPSLICCFFGVLWRKVFGIDKKLKESLEKNGYDSNQKI